MDAQAEARPADAIQDAKARIEALAGPTAAVLRTELWAVIADAYTEQSQPGQAHAAIESARAEMQDLAPSPFVARLRLRLDLLDDQLLIGNSDSVTAVTQTSRLLAGLPASNLERACTLSIRAVAYDYLHQAELAVADALAAYQIAQDGHWSNAKLEAAGTLARVFSGAGLFPQAEQMINVVIGLAKTDNRTSLLSTAEYERGLLLVKARNFAGARAAFMESNVYATEIGDRFAIAVTNAALCWELVNEGDLDAAEAVCSGGDDDLASGHREDLAIELAGNRARLDLERHRPTKALEKLDRVLTPALHALLPRSEPQFYWDRARALQALHRNREANADLIQMHELEEAADTAQRNRQVAVLSALVASADLATANRQLQQRMDRQQTEAKQQREQRTTLLAAMLVTGTLLVYLLWISQRHSRELRRQDIILRSAGHNAPDSFLLLDERRRVRFANRNLCGHGRTPVVGDSVLSALPSAVRPPLNAAIEEAFESRTVVTFAATLTDVGESPRQFEICVVPAVEHERVIGGTVRAIDVTDHQALERQVVDSASHERQRLSSELHDGVGQQLAGVVLLLGNASHAIKRKLPNGLELIEEITRYVQEAIAAMRELSRGLAPVAIGVGSLPLALQRLVADASRRLRIEVQCECLLYDIRLSSLAADHLYCICREAVTNAALHGRCTAVSLVVKADAQTLTMSISDNGTGWAPSDSDSQGLGIKMMAYRTRLLGGQCRIEASPQGGTCVRATVPLVRVIE